MKRILIYIAAMAALVSCTKEQQTTISSDMESVLALADDFRFGGNLTKTTISQEGTSAPTFAWKAGDVIGVIPMDGKTVQSNYEISSIGNDPKTATFDGGVWALKTGKGYAAYYPYQKEAVLSGESLEFSFLGQTQSANNSLAHIGAYDYMYASAVVASSSATSFSFKHLVSLVRLQITVPKTDQYTSLTLESTVAWFAGKAALSLADGAMTSTQSLKAYSVALNDISVNKGDVLTVWFSMLPTEALNGGSMTVKLTGKDSFATASISDVKTFEAGKAYSFSCAADSEEETGYVDLGLSVKWATCNLGATSPEEYGDYYAWGETETKSNYSYENYIFYKKEISTDNDGFEVEYKGYTKYAPSGGYKGYTDNKLVLDPEDDVAHVKLGGSWRMPTQEEMKELRDNCDWVWCEYKNVRGVKFTSKKEGYTNNWLFFPAAGCRDYSSTDVPGEIGRYRTSTLLSYNSAGAYGLYISSGFIYSSLDDRCPGETVRAVRE